MRASARLVVGADGRILTLTEEPPIGLRATPDALYLVGTAGGPTGSDHTCLDVTVQPGGHLRLRSSASTVVWSGAGSRQEVRVRVGARAQVDWAPEPLIVTSGADHVVDVRLDLDGEATVVWSDVVLLGRHGEDPGRARLRLRADVGARPLLRHDLDVGPGADRWDGPAVLGGARATAVRLVAGPTLPPLAAGCGEGWAWLDLEGPGRLLSAVAPDLPTLQQRLREAGGATIL